jgi:hypothetical protein
MWYIYRSRRIPNGRTGGTEAGMTAVLQVGDKMPIFELPTMEGQAVGLEDFAGKRFIIFMWASW